MTLLAALELAASEWGTSEAASVMAEALRGPRWRLCAEGSGADDMNAVAWRIRQESASNRLTASPRAEYRGATSFFPHVHGADHEHHRLSAPHPRPPGTHRFRHRPGLHGHVRLLWAERGVDQPRGAQPRDRHRGEFPRHRRHVRRR